MEYFLTEEQKAIQDLARQVADEKIRPLAAKYDETEEYPWELIKHLADTDLLGLFIPQEYGGYGAGNFEQCLAIEQISRGCCAVATAYAANALGTYPIILFGNDEQKRKYLTPVAKGQKLAAFGLTEANAGSDVSGIRTTAEKDGDYYILNGVKQWITNGEVAEIYTVLAITNKTKGPRGLSAFIVEKGTEGFTFGKKEKKLGIRCSATCELYFTDCRVPKENLIGREGTGFLAAMGTFDKSRPCVGAQAVGLAQAAFDEALAFATTRVQFGQPVSSFQAVGHMLSDMATEIEAARALVYAAAKTVDSGQKKVSKISAMAKQYASDMAMKVTTNALQVMGGSGYMRELPVEKMFRDAKILQIYEGTNQIQRNIILLELVKELKKSR